MILGGENQVNFLISKNGTDVNEKDTDGNTLLHVAASNCIVKIY